MAKNMSSQASWEQEKYALEQHLEQLQKENFALQQQLSENLNDPDCTEKKKAQEALHKSEQKFSVIFEKSAFAAALSERHTGVLVDVNEAWVRTFGYSKQEAVGKTTLELDINPDQEARNRLLAQFKEQNSVHNFPLSLRVRSGELRSFLVDIDIVEIDNQKYLLNSVQDITEREQAEKALQESEKKYRELVQYAPSGIYGLDLLGNRFTTVNDAMCQITGYSREELLAMRPFDLVDEPSQKLFLSRVARWLSGEKPDQNVEYKVIAKDGHGIEVVLNTTFNLDENGRPCGATVVAYDITERKRIEQALQESERQYRELVQFAPAGIYEVDFRRKRFISVNDVMCMMTGYSREELLQMSPFNLLDEDSQQVFQTRIYQWLAGEKPDQNVEYKVITKDGREIIAILNTTFTVDENGKPYGATVVAHDITDRKRMEDALRKSEAEFRVLFEQSNTGKVEYSPIDNTFVRVNQKFCELTGYSEEEILSMNINQLTHPDDRQRDNEAYEAALRGDTDGWKIEKRYIRKDGAIIWVEVLGSVIRDPAGHPYLSFAVVQDITYRKKMEQALQEYANRLEQSNQDLERFAIIASHDLQEPLRKISTFGERVKTRIGDQMDEESLLYVSRIQDASQRMQKMIDGLLALSRVTTRGQPFVMVDLNNVAEAVVSDLEDRIREYQGEVILSELPEIMADPVQIHQLLQNLILNGLKFHNIGASPRVEVYAKVIPSADATHQAGQVKIFVQDNGIGFDELLTHRIFHPFERLVGRAAYEGSGIGLAICKKIVDRHGGTITARSKPGVGSTFIVSLPV